MKHLFTKIFLFHLLLIGAVQVTAQNKKSGNPILTNQYLKIWK